MKYSAWIFSLLLLPIFSHAQESGVIPLGNNFLYRGIDNPIKVLVEGYSCDSLIVTSNMKLRRYHRCEYHVVPMKEHTGEFRIFALNKGDTVFVGQHEFRLLITPDPVARIDGSHEGRIIIGRLIEARGIEAKLDDFIYDTKFKVTSYTALIERGDRVLYTEDIQGERWTTSLISKFRELGPLDKVIFEHIKAEGPAGIERHLDPLVLQLR